MRRFLQALHATLLAIEQRPKSCSHLETVADDLPIHRAITKRFPNLVIVEIRPDEVVVLAVPFGSLPVLKHQPGNSTELSGVMCDERQPVCQSDRGNHQVVGTNRGSCPSEFFANSTEFRSRLIIERQRHKPFLQSSH